MNQGELFQHHKALMSRDDLPKNAKYPTSSWRWSLKNVFA